MPVPLLSWPAFFLLQLVVDTDIGHYFFASDSFFARLIRLRCDEPIFPQGPNALEYLVFTLFLRTSGSQPARLRENNATAAKKKKRKELNRTESHRASIYKERLICFDLWLAIVEKLK